MNQPASVPLRSGLPRHEQVSSWLLEQIECNDLGVDDQLPSESQLCERFSVSRITVRRALQTLEADGIIYKRQGLGSFVQGAQIRQGFVNLTDFDEDMTAAGISARSETLSWETEEATSKVAHALDIPARQLVIRLDRLRYGNGEPVAFDSTWLPVMLGNLIKDGVSESQAIYQVLEKKAGIRISHRRFRIEAVNAPNDIAGHLNIPWGRALLLIERTTYAADDRPVCFQTRHYRCDRVAYELVLDRGPENGSILAGGPPLRELKPVFKS